MSDNRTTELLPCPFCGGEAHIVVSSDGYGVECWGELCSKNQLEEIPTEAEAIAAWNTRAERTCKPHGEWERVSQTQEVRHIYCDCDEYLGMDRRDSFPFEIECKADMPNYCPNCGAKVVSE